ncbi:MAG: hypothetical protein IIA87_03185 [Nanoarchaeota archaeon]|nr:hypothetical protein [Nanoarchaeota archaeon]
MEREYDDTQRIEIIYHDKNKRVIATCDIGVEESLEKTYGLLKLAYEGNKISESDFHKHTRELRRLGLEVSAEDKDKTRVMNALARKLSEGYRADQEATLPGLIIEKLQIEKALRMLSDQRKTLKRISRFYGEAA